MDMVERPSKRRRITASLSSTVSESYLRGYLTIAQAEFTIVHAQPCDAANHLDQNTSPTSVVIKKYSGASLLNLADHHRKQLPEWSIIESCTDQARQLLDECVKLESVLKYEKDSAACPLACYYATIEFTPTSAHPDAYTLTASILWRNDTVARDKVKDEHWAIWNSHFLDKSAMQLARQEPWDPRQFYESVHVPDRDSQHVANLKPDLLQSKLYPFQERAVYWLLHREGVAVEPTGQVRALQIPKNALPVNFHQTTDLDGHICYVNHSLGVASTDLEEVQSRYSSVKGGILAEEMGLGKTVELIALMCLHRRDASPVHQVQFDSELIKSSATLIITPPTILQQWIQELKQHSPALQVYHYEGMHSEARRKTDGLQNEDTATQLVKRLADNDVVVTTYNVIAKEVHYVDEVPDRHLRRQKPVYERPKSPLMQISWWRVCLDEAQKVESGVSNAAIVARKIPRVNAWAVSGTPLKKDHKDLFGLLTFLRYEPWCVSQRLWDRLVAFHRPLFRALMGEIAIRHSKDFVRDDLRLPPQSRQTITVPFTAIEEQYYGQMFTQMCDEVGLDGKGDPLNDDWDPSSQKITESMRQWLVRLRQICLHPEVGGRNRKALGRSGGPLRTVLQVLDVMIDQNDVEVRAEQRTLLLSRIRRGQLQENAKHTKAAMALWQSAYEESGQIVDECRAEYEIARADWRRDKESKDEPETDEEDALDEKSGSTRLTTCRQKLRAALEVKHMCIFFLANGYFQLKSDENAVKPDSEEFNQLEKQEEEAYEVAKSIRGELLAQALKKASRFMDGVKKDAEKGLVQLPDMGFDLEYSGIESRKVFDKLHHFCKAMNAQAEQYRKLRQKMVEFLSESLIDADEGVELKGDEYESSTKHQDEMYAYMEMLRALFADRGDAVSGQENILIKHEMKMLQRAAQEGEGPAPELMLKLLAERARHRIPSDLGSLRGIVSEVRQLVTALQWQEGGGSTRARAELGITEQLLQQCQKLVGVQAKAVSSLEQEVNRIRDTMNNRLEYYRALQKISDTVAPFEEHDVGKPIDDARSRQMLLEEERRSHKLSNYLTKKRYLQHLKAESTSDSPARICVICQSDFELGTLTVCGHQFCKECIQLWYAAHKTCPVCKKYLRGTDFWDVTYKPPELAMQKETSPAPLSSPGSGQGPERSSNKSIYSDVSTNTLNEIKRVDLDGSSFGSKVDTICRHILWLRYHDPGSKAIIFSQYREFLEVLGRAFKQSGIAWTRFDEKNGIEKFKSDPVVECFLLDSKAQSAGLNLVAANHVFLCEPLINTAIELQAIARVHRIGQQRATTVWMYLVANTVEETIYEISVDRRLEHMKGKAKDRIAQTSRSGTATPSVLENQIDAANTMELQAADLSKLLTSGRSGGELVEERDLWQCLFRRPRHQETGMAQAAANRAQEAADRADSEVGRFLRAEAAERRAGS
jgi:E3 ubiquitin-protein ligase SHPRH